MDYRQDFNPNSELSYSHCTYIVLDSTDFFTNFGQTDFPSGFFDPNQRFSVDNSKTFLKCNGYFPTSFTSKFSSVQGPYTFAEMSGIINTPEWTS